MVWREGYAREGGGPGGRGNGGRETERTAKLGSH